MKRYTFRVQVPTDHSNLRAPRQIAIAIALVLVAALATALSEPRRTLRPTPEEPRLERETRPPRPALAPPLERPRTEPPALRWIPVSGDVPALVGPGFGDSERAIVYLHGMCGDPARAREWGAAAQAFGTLIALRGGSACPGHAAGHYWSGDPTFLDYRIRKAVRSVSRALERPLDDERVVLLGYSQGAQRAEDLAWVFPERYGEVALMSGPGAPSYDKLHGVRALAITRGSREYKKSWRQAADRLSAAGLGARYFELPGAAHGQFGPEAPRVLTEIFEHLTSARGL